MEVREGGGLGFRVNGGVLTELLEEGGDEAIRAGGLGREEFGAGSDGAQVRVGDGLFDDVLRCCVRGLGRSGLAEVK